MGAAMDDQRLVALAQEGNPDAFSLLREMEGYSYREIAKALGLEEGTVKSRLARARVLLRSELLSHGNFWGREASKETKGKGGDLE